MLHAEYNQRVCHRQQHTKCLCWSRCLSASWVPCSRSLGVFLQLLWQTLSSGGLITDFCQNLQWKHPPVSREEGKTPSATAGDSSPTSSHHSAPSSQSPLPLCGGGLRAVGTASPPQFSQPLTNSSSLLRSQPPSPARLGSVTRAAALQRHAANCKYIFTSVLFSSTTFLCTEL